MASLKKNNPLVTLFLILIGISFLLPFYYMIITSFKSMDTYLVNKFLPPAKLTLDNYTWSFAKQNILLNYRNNVLILISTLIPFIFLTTGAGFAIGKLNIPFKKTFLFIISAIMVLPQMVLTIPLYRELAQMHLLNSMFGLILIYLAYFGPYSAYLMATYFRNVPDTYIEAALIDGAGLWRIYGSIMLPMAKPMIMTVLIIASQQVWNELTFALILIRTSSKRTIMAAMALLSGQYGMSSVNAAAILLLASLPMLILYIIFQKNIQQGILAGGIKE
ncbi:MAG: carbohydrate ABC transporter permease [Bacteroidetes bacterium]|nr:carbohydrate ABC transporter permease [Bacteroidota bacterium]